MALDVYVSICAMARVGGNYDFLGYIGSLTKFAGEGYLLNRGRLLLNRGR